MIWDRFIRLFHWSVAVLFLANFWWLDDGDDAHEWAGYTLLALLLARLIWGFVGPTNARFSDFLPTPARLCDNWQRFGEYQRQHRHNSRHSPVGGLMVLLLLLMLTVTGVSGWMQELDAFWGEDWVQNLHRWAANSVMAMVVIHVVAVLLIQWRYRVPLLQGMLPGIKDNRPQR
ncbi:cytochrome b/b6 domain-containing protein [Candidatus Thalassolituus haligoni]|uniref:cytochrome b/b6 domain-containing protein n=1 Tax=Candidatus Thalassolituus haligoni TaxID=3100113 RepID=UPI00351618C2